MCGVPINPFYVAGLFLYPMKTSVKTTGHRKPNGHRKKENLYLFDQ